jgi:hypothetical protein
MSGLVSVGGIEGLGLAGANLFAAVFSTPRYIQGGNTLSAAEIQLRQESNLLAGTNIPTDDSTVIVPDCAVDEEGEDVLTITSHPVQAGANIGDHAYKEPASLTLHWSWSNSSSANTGGFGLGTLTGFTGASDYVQQIYNQLLSLQVNGQLLTISTGKRLYTNMLIKSISPRTDFESEYALPCEIMCEELIIANTQVASIPAADQTAPQQTQPIENQGTQQAAPSTTAPNNSLLNQMFGKGGLVNL